jgi:hypothetical protein
MHKVELPRVFICLVSEQHGHKKLLSFCYTSVSRCFLAGMLVADSKVTNLDQVWEVNMQARILVQLLGISLVVFLFSSEAFAQTQTEEHPIEVGGFLTAIDLKDSVAEKPLGLGGRFTYNFTKNFALDSEVSYFPEGGGGDFGETIALVGLRAGARTEDFGVFAKVRPGVIHFGGNAFRARNSSPTRFALDAGAVVEFYPSPRVILRADFGDTIIPFGNDTLNSALPPHLLRPGTTHNFQGSFGVGFRF